MIRMTSRTEGDTVTEMRAMQDCPSWLRQLLSEVPWLHHIAGESRKAQEVYFRQQGLGYWYSINRQGIKDSAELARSLAKSGMETISAAWDPEQGYLMIGYHQPAFNSVGRAIAQSQYVHWFAPIEK